MCKIESEKRGQSEVKVMLCTGDGEVKLRYNPPLSLETLCYSARETYHGLFTFLSTTCHRAHIDQSGTLLLG